MCILVDWPTLASVVSHRKYLINVILHFKQIQANKCICDFAFTEIFAFASGEF